MKKIVTIHQPETFPWLGFFNKMMLCDEYILLDDVQFRKNYFQNRNQFLTKQGPIYLTVPVDFKNYKLIKDIKIKYNEKWQQKHLNTIKQNYSKSPYFNQHINFFELFYAKKYELLIDFNIEIINYIREVLGINVPIKRLSEMGTFNTSSSDLLLEICKSSNATVYLSGRDGKNYLDETIFKDENIDVVYHSFEHPIYNQFNSNEFVPYISTFDLLFNYDREEAKNIIINGGRFCES